MILRIFYGFCGWDPSAQAVPRATALFESRLAARHVAAFVREEHFENCSSLRHPLQKLFDVLVCLVSFREFLENRGNTGCFRMTILEFSEIYGDWELFDLTEWEYGIK